MSYEEQVEMLEILKKEYPDHEEFEKKGTKYIRFPLIKLDIPKKLGKPYLQIVWDGNDAYVVITKSLGLTPEEKEKKSKMMAERSKDRDEIRKLAQELKSNVITIDKKTLDEKRTKYDDMVGKFEVKHGILFGRKKKQ